MSATPTNLVLDAMGVLYQSGDDVAELLVPFIRKRHPSVNIVDIEHAYVEASLGHINNNKFWRKLNLDPDIEDDYLLTHTLMNGVTAFLQNANSKFAVIGCLSNDVAAWSLKLRNRFLLTNWITHWIVSGNVGYRKPSLEIYSLLINRLQCQPPEILFVDDREKNLDAAKSLGINTVLFDITGTHSASAHRTITRLTDLLN